MKYLLSLIFILFTNISFAVTYYVSNNGSDSNTGTSPGSSWKTVNKIIQEINNNKIQSGDIVLFNRGDVFYGELRLEGINFLTVGAYGTGNKPLLTGLYKQDNWNKYSGNIYYSTISSGPSQVKWLKLNGIIYDKGREPDGEKNWFYIDNALSNDQFRDNDRTEPTGFWDDATVVTQEQVWGEYPGWSILRSEIQSYYSDGTINLETGGEYGIGSGYGYFFVDGINTLDNHGEWCYNEEQKRIYVYLDNEPVNYSLEVSLLDNSLEINNCDNIVIKDINISSFNERGVEFTNTDNITLENVDFNNLYEAILVKNSSDNIIRNNAVFNATGNGIRLEHVQNTHILNNEVQNVASNYTMAEDAAWGANMKGIVITHAYLDGLGWTACDSIVVRGNYIKNVGYSGIQVTRSNKVYVQNNIVIDPMQLKHDGGAYYFWECDNIKQSNENQLDYEYCVVTNNYFHFTPGEIKANWNLPHPENAFYGYYFDDKCKNFRIEDNVGIGAVLNLFLHGNQNMLVKNNTLLGTDVTTYNYYSRTGGGNGLPSIGNSFINNIATVFFSGGDHGSLAGGWREVESDYTWSGNYWMLLNDQHPAWKPGTVLYEGGSVSGTNDYTVESWNSSGRNDGTAKGAPFKFSESGLNNAQNMADVYYNFSNTNKQINIENTFGTDFYYYDKDGNKVSGEVIVPPYGNYFVLRSNNLLSEGGGSNDPPDTGSEPSDIARTFDAFSNQKNNVTVSAGEFDTDVQQVRLLAKLNFESSDHNDGLVLQQTSDTNEVSGSYSILSPEDNAKFYISLWHQSSSGVWNSKANRDIVFIDSIGLEPSEQNGIFDDFNNYSTPLNVNNPWTNVKGQMRVTTNQSGGIGNATHKITGDHQWESISYYNNFSFNNDQFSQVQLISPISHQGVGVSVRTTSEHAYILKVSDSEYTLQKWNNIGGNDETTNLFSGTYTFASGDSIKLEITGDTLKMFKNGIQFGGDITDDEFITGSPGIFTWGISNGYLDNWRGGNIKSDPAGDQNHPPKVNEETLNIGDDKVNGTYITTITASDPDIGQSLTYAINGGNTEEAFQTDNTGKITVNNSDALKTYDVFHLTVQATDNGNPELSGTATIIIHINHINDPPVIQDEQLTITDDLIANSTFATLSVSDPDHDQMLSFAIISGNKNSAFKIDQVGNLMVNQPNALLTEDNFNLTVSVNDNGTPSLSDNGIVNISVNHVNDPPVINDQQVTISDDMLPDALVTTVTGSDPDPGQKLTFSISGGNTNNAFYIDNTGNIKVNNSSSLETHNSFQLLIDVSDNGNPSLSDNATVDVLINHVNDPPVVNNQQVTISDQLSNGSFVMQVNASDPDVDQSLNYMLVSGNQNNAFTLDSRGRLSVNNNQALTSVNLFQLIVEVSDDGSPGMTAGATMSIYVEHSVTNQPVIPVAPENMFGLVNNQSILLSWTDKSSNEDNFIVQRKQNAGSYTNLITLDANITNFTDETIEDGNVYTYRVYAKNQVGSSAMSNAYTLEYTDSSLYNLKAPANLDFSIDGEIVKLTWDDMSVNETGFILEKRDNQTTKIIFDTLFPNTDSYIDSNVTFSDELQYRISAFNKLFKSAYSNTVFVKIDESVEPVSLDIPQDVNATAFDSDSIEVSWTYATSADITFLIEKIDHNTKETTLWEVSGTWRDFTDKNITPFTTYNYRMATINGKDTSLFSSYITINTGEARNPLEAKAPAIIGYKLKEDGISLFFDNQNIGEHYVIERSISDTMNFFQIASISVERDNYHDVLSFPDLFVYYRVKIKYDAFESPYSNIVQVINPNAYNEFDLLVEAELTSDQDYALTWNEVPGCTHYSIEQKLSTDSKFNIIETDYKQNNYTNYFPFSDNAELSYRISAHYDTISLVTSNIVSINKNFIQGYDQFSAENHINASVYLSWNDEKMSEVTKTTIYRASAGSSNFSVVASILQDNYLDTALNANTEYSYYIEYYMNDGRLKMTSEIITVTTNDQLAIVQPVIHNISSQAGMVSISWSDSADYEKIYLVERANSLEEGFNQISELSRDSFYTDDHVEYGKSYYYRIQSIVESVWTVYSPVELIYVPSENEAKRDHEGMVAGYNFSNSGSEVPDVSNYSDPLNLVEINMDNSKIGKDKEQKVYASTYPANKILESVKKTGEFSMECWIKPKHTKAPGLQQIITIENKSGRLFGLFQDNGAGNGIHDYFVNFRTASTNNDGKPDFRAKAKYDYHAIHHVVYTRNNDGVEKLYMDGKLVNSNVRASNVNNWIGEFYLSIAGNTDGTPSWKGDMYYLAMYNLEMNPSQIEKNYLAGPYEGFHDEFTDITIKVYPNPANEFVHVELTPITDFSSGDRIQLMMINQTGTLLFQQVVTDPSYEQIINIELDEYKPGIYMIYIMGDGWKKTKRLIKN